MKNSEVVDKLVHKYLEHKGYQNARTGLEKDAKVDLQPLGQFAFDLSLEADASVANHILFYSAGDASADQYDQSYGRLCDWTSSALEDYRKELSAVSYPLFVHCYLELLDKGFEKEAPLFLNKYLPLHQEEHGEEIGVLRGVTRQHLADNESALKFRRNKYVVSLSSQSFELLTGFLQSAKLTLLLGICVQFIRFQIYSAEPLNEDERELQMLNGSVPGGRSHAIFNQHKNILWGTIREKDSVSEKGVETWEKSRGVQMSNEPVLKKSKLENGEVPSHATNPVAVPRQNLSEAEELRILDDLRERIAVTCTGPLPSACLYTFLNARRDLNSITISHSGSRIVAGFDDSSLRLWDADPALEPPLTAPAKEYRDKIKGDRAYVPLVGHSGPVYAAAFSPDDKYIVSAGEDRTARLWDMNTYSNVVCYKGHNFPIWDVDFSPIGVYFATASADRTARLWSTDHIYPLRLFAGHLSDVDCVKFHPNSNYIATGSSDKTVRLWDVQSGKCVRLYTGHTSPVQALAFSPSGRLLASADDKGDITIWDLASEGALATLKGHTKPVWSLQFSHGAGDLLASAGGDHTVRLWDVNQPALLAASRGRTVEQPQKDPLLRTFYTKSTPVLRVMWTARNLLVGGGVFRPDPK